eukprot:1887614-Pleurochrysis_carterae.AAC.1
MKHKMTRTRRTTQMPAAREPQSRLKIRPQMLLVKKKSNQRSNQRYVVMHLRFQQRVHDCDDNDDSVAKDPKGHAGAAPNETGGDKVGNDKVDVEQEENQEVEEANP